MQITIRLAGGRYDDGAYGLTFGRDEVPDELYAALQQCGVQEQSYGPEGTGRCLVLRGSIGELRQQIARALGRDCLAVHTTFGRINELQVDDEVLFVEIELRRVQSGREAQEVQAQCDAAR